MRALALLTTLLAVSPQAGQRRGAFAFHYRAPLTPRELRWFSRFDLLVTHDPLPRAQVDALHAPQKHPDALLNRAGLRGGAGSADADAWYYDPASEEHGVQRARAIARRLFLDTITERACMARRSRSSRRGIPATTTTTTSRASWRACGAS